MNQQWTNRLVLDSHHSKVGKVTDVFFGDIGDEPEWASVKTGLLAEHLAPLDGAYLTDDGVLVLPFDEQTIKTGPKPPRDHVLTDTVAQEAIHHYDMA